MQELKLWETNFKKFVNYYNSLEELIDFIKDKKKTSFYVLNDLGLEKEEPSTGFVENLNSIAQEHDLKIIYFDDSHISFEDNLNQLCIENNFFEQNKDAIIKAIEENLFDKEYVFINKHIYSENLVKNLILIAQTIVFEDGVEISSEIKALLRKSRINSYIRRAGEKEEISSSKILGTEYESVISESEFLSIKADINDLENLKFVPSNKIIEINPKSYPNMSFDELENVYNIIYKLRENGQENKIIIRTSDRKSLLNSKIYHSNFKNIKIDGIDLIEYELEDFKNENELLYLMIQDIKNSNFSSFEKYIAVYNIVKKFKQYKENSEDKDESRKLSKFLNNDYMVCVGYARLLEVLLEKIGISSYHYSVSTDTSYDDGFTIEEKPTLLAGHARVIVNIEDPKYNIKGFYVADPTWDNDLTNDYYNHALMSFDKTCQERRYFALSDEDLLLNCKNMTEFNDRVNFLMEKSKRNTFVVKEENAYRDVVSEIKKILSSLDYELYKKLESKYPALEEELFKSNNPKYLQDFITDAGYIFIKKLGNDVPIETVIDAACVVNLNVFDLDEEQKELYKECLLEENIKLDKLKFPYYYETNKSFVA